VRREEFEAIALAGGEPARELMVALLDQVAEIVVLRERIEELERQAGRDAFFFTVSQILIEQGVSDAPRGRQ
jgi:hypothetical protein